MYDPALRTPTHFLTRRLEAIDEQRQPYNHNDRLVNRCCWQMRQHVGRDLCLSKTETVCTVEMDSAIVSQHCELEPRVHFKMKSVRNVRWMWRCGDTMTPFFALLKCNILPFVFPPQPVFLNEGLSLMKHLQKQQQQGEWMNEWVGTHTCTHTQRCSSIQTHTGTWFSHTTVLTNVQ